MITHKIPVLGSAKHSIQSPAMSFRIGQRRQSPKIVKPQFEQPRFVVYTSLQSSTEFSHPDYVAKPPSKNQRPANSSEATELRREKWIKKIKANANLLNTLKQGVVEPIQASTITRDEDFS